MKVIYITNNLIIGVRNYYSPDNSSTSTDTLKIDAKNRIVERDNYSKSGELFTKTFLKYDSNNRLIEETTYNSDGSTMVTYQFKYNIDGDIIEDNDNWGGHLNTRTYSYQKYDSVGNWLHRTEYIDGREWQASSRNIYYHK